MAIVFLFSFFFFGVPFSQFYFHHFPNASTHKIFPTIPSFFAPERIYFFTFGPCNGAGGIGAWHPGVPDSRKQREFSAGRETHGSRLLLHCFIASLLCTGCQDNGKLYIFYFYIFTVILFFFRVAPLVPFFAFDELNHMKKWQSFFFSLLPFS